MQVKVRVRGEVAIVDLEGRLVYGEGDDELKQAIQGLIDRGTCRLVINMERVEFMDSSGMVALITCHKQASGKGGEIRILKPTRRAAELLAIARITEFIRVFDDEEKALEGF